jgi:ubiquinone/menaquinone biosynthesis C-methylase UbiE
MTSFDEVANHYGDDALLDAISNGVRALGKTKKSLTIEDLAPVDEFHIGGAAATRTFLDKLGINANDHVLDVGCGIGGASRFAAATYGCRVTGVDLTREYVETGRELCRWLELEDRVQLCHGNALSTNFANDTFDTVFLLHVGMNIPDKGALAAEAWRVLKPGGVLGVFDVMRKSEGDLTFPVPWSTTPATSFVATPAEYRTSLEEAGFVVREENDRGGMAAKFFTDLQDSASGAEGPPPLGLHLLMGPDAQEKVRNMIYHVLEGSVAPVEMVAEKITQLLPRQAHSASTS